MKVKFNICSNNVKDYCTITVTDTTDEFLADESPLEKNQYRKKDITVLDIITYTCIDNKETIISSIISNEPNTFDIKRDGWYKLYHIILPNKEWLEEAKNLKWFNSFLNIYYINLDKVYSYKENQSILVEDLSILFEMNSVNTTINRLILDYFSIHNLMKCYINTAKILLSLYFKCSNELPKELTFKRDYLWMLINVIKYSVDIGDFAGAVMRLYKFDYCNGLCNNTLVENDCGCNN